MALPNFQDFMLHLLQSLSDVGEQRMKDVANDVARRLGLTSEQCSEMLSSGHQPIFRNRTAWAKAYLQRAGLVESPSRGIVRITNIGERVLRNPPNRIDVMFLKQFPSFAEFYSAKSSRNAVENSESTDATPEEQLDEAYKILRSSLESELLDQVKSISPGFFERLVVELLVAMGYGGSLADAGRAVGRSGDGGIDGIIKEDRLGLDFVCIQAKRWERSVGRPEVQSFAGSMEGFRASKGVMITTSTFTKDAREYVQQIQRRVVLIDGKQLAELMVDHGIGVSTAKSIQIKQIDHDYFVDDE